MAGITIRHLDDDVKTRLGVRAGDNGRSTEEEARSLRDVVERKPSSQNLPIIIRSHFCSSNRVRRLQIPVPAARRFQLVAGQDL